MTLKVGRCAIMDEKDKKDLVGVGWPTITAISASLGCFFLGHDTYRVALLVLAMAISSLVQLLLINAGLRKRLESPAFATTFFITATIIFWLILNTIEPPNHRHSIWVIWSTAIGISTIFALVLGYRVYSRKHSNR